MVKTPAFTTATACNSALTGVGATMADGNQRCTGIRAALPMPKQNRQTRIVRPVTLSLSVRTPPGVNCSVPAVA